MENLLNLDTYHKDKEWGRSVPITCR